MTSLVLGMSLFLTGSCGSSSSPTTPTSDFIALIDCSSRWDNAQGRGPRHVHRRRHMHHRELDWRLSTMLLADRFNRLPRPLTSRRSYPAEGHRDGDVEQHHHDLREWHRQDRAADLHQREQLHSRGRLRETTRFNKPPTDCELVQLRA